MIKSFFAKKNKWDYGKKAKKIEKKLKKMEIFPVLAPFFGGHGFFGFKNTEKWRPNSFHFFYN